jgi:hypothetical protein
MLRNLAIAGLLLFLLFDLGHQGRDLEVYAPQLPEVPASLVTREFPAVREAMTSRLPQPAVAEKASGGPPLGHRSAVPLVKVRELEPVVKKYASLHGVDEDLVWAVIRHESGFNPRAVSPKGAMGLMQLMPGTASLMGVAEPFNIEENIAGGTKYLEQCLSQFHQDLVLALAAYNAGPQNVTKYQGCPPFPETRQYVAAVLQTYSGHPQYRRLGLGGSVSDEVAALLDKVGLHWRVLGPQWKIAEPQFHVKSPQWKGTRANLVTLVQ